MAVTDLVTPPTTETGSTGSQAGILPWSAYFDDQEHVPELTWPMSLETYGRMRNDPQIAAILRAIKTPVRRMRWSVDPNGTDPAVYERVADDLGLPIKGHDDRPVGEPAGSFDFDYTLRHVLLMLDYGFMFFEQVAEVGPDWTHLRKLAERMPRTIGNIKVDRTGGLESVTQNFGIAPAPIGVDRLVAFVNEKEGANWTGRSLLRPLYQPWRIKDVLWRLDVMRHERAAVPTPVATNPPDASRSAELMMQQMTEAFKGGQASGATLPHGANLALLSGGKSTDIIESIRYCDQAMAKALLVQFIELGQTQTGSRALAGEFTDFFADSLDSLVGMICKVLNRHVVADMVAWNQGRGAASPRIVAERDPHEYPTAELVQLIDAGAITVDDETEAWVRARGRAPQRTTPRPVEDADAAPPAEDDEDDTEATASPSRFVAQAARRQAPQKGAGRRTPMTRLASALRGGWRRQRGPALKLPDRPLHRAPSEVEIRAGVDFARMDATFDDAFAALLTEWKRDVSPVLFESAHEAVRQAGSISDIEALKLDPVGVDVLERFMLDVARDAMDAATKEAIAQGTTPPAPDTAALEEVVAARAQGMATMIADGLAGTAARRAMQAWNGDAGFVADNVLAHLKSLSDANLEAMLTGSLMQAEGDGRRAVYEKAPKGTWFYASELLDEATCDHCEEADETRYETLAATAAEYPTGGNIGCRGMWRCRGTIIAVYGDEGTSVEDDT